MSRAITIVPAALPAHTELHPQARPYCRLALLQVPILGPVVAPWHEGFVPDTAQWSDLTGKPVRTAYPDGTMIGQTLGQAITRVWDPIDVKALDAEDLRANPRTEGLAIEAPVVATGVRVIGKESRHLGAGREILTSPEYVEYGDEGSWSDVLNSLKLLGHEANARETIAEETGISSRWLELIRAGRCSPSSETRCRLLAVVAARARRWIARTHPSVELSRTDMGVLAMYLDLSPPSSQECQQCARLLRARQRRWCPSVCRKRHERRPARQLTLSGLAERE
jgi:hypothetical protein